MFQGRDIWAGDGRLAVVGGLRRFATKKADFSSVFVGLSPGLVRFATGETRLTRSFSIIYLAK
jgi:hypothetical protein